MKAAAGPAELSSSFPIVGIGASAGGLEAFMLMLRALPPDTGMGFVLVQHLSPNRPSLLSEILARTTAMPVVEVQDEPQVKPNHVYVIPPGRDMTISEGGLRLLPREEVRGQHRSIDHFFRSLAEDQGHRAIGVILSGTATDGTLGMGEIKAAGGITFAQDDSAQQNSMPRSAIAAGFVDFVLPPDEIAEEIARLAGHPYVHPAPEAPQAVSLSEPGLTKILYLLHDETGVDFRQYKVNTLSRRVSRRMVLLKVKSLKDYARLLRNNPAELEALYRDILINVTSFFRDPEMFEALKVKVFPKLFKDRSRHQPIRIWVLGCSTGEEAYSLAIALTELAESRNSHLPIQIFATDLNGVGIDKARAGLYSKDLTHDVSPERLRRFFVEVDGHDRVSKSIRDMCVFARHDLLKDPPFSQIDLISCRNLLIYLEPEAQQRAVPLLHYALRPEGFLVLGSSETVGSYRDLFEVEDAAHKIFVKKPGTGRLSLGIAVGIGGIGGKGSPALPRRSGSASAGSWEDAGTADIQKEADRILIAKYAPPGVVTNADLEIQQFRGDTGPYLAPAPGKASLSLLKMVREGLRVPLRAAISQAQKERTAVHDKGLRLESDGGTRQVHLQVIPIGEKAARNGGFLVLFEEAAPAPPQRKGRKGTAPALQAAAAGPQLEAERQNALLTEELAATREYLQSVIEQQEAANEELQSANEEVQSTNEELQSINEELETSKEEIQSTNEELVTVNDELQNRNQELSQSTNDMVNLLANVQAAIVMLGRDLRIRRFTPAAEKRLGLSPTDIGRPVGAIRFPLALPDLEPLILEVIDSVSFRELEIQDRDGCWFLLQIRPYKTLENRIDGAVMMLVDVDKLKRAHELVQSIVATVREPLVVLDADLRVQSANRSFYETFQLTPAETEGHPLYELGDGLWNIPALRRLLVEISPENPAFDGFEVEHEFERVGRKVMVLNARRLVHGGGAPLILFAIEDVTERKRMEENLHGRIQDLATADRDKDDFLALLAHELRNPLAPLRNAVQVLEVPQADAAAVARAREIMNRQIHNMARLIEDLLDASRLNRGKVRLRRERVEIGALLRQTVELARPYLEARSQDLSISLPGQPVYLDADSTRLEQIFINLLNNASKFTPIGGHLELSAELAGGEVAVRVRDNGAGIPAEMLQRVFDLFVQAQRSLDRSQGGLGIGLTLVRSLVELHGGSVEASSPGVDQGSEFAVRLPVLSDAEAKGYAEPPSQSATGSEPPAVSSSPRRILVVDDNQDTAETLAVLLRFRGHLVEVAHSGPEALETAGSFEPEVALLDIGLPGLDGYEVARRLRQHPLSAKTTLVAVTGYGQEEDRRLAYAAGFDHHLTKPVDPQILYDLIVNAPPPAG